MNKLAVTEFKTFNESIKEALDNIDAAPVLEKQKDILIKPNLINTSPPPITTPAACVEAIAEYIKNCSEANIIVAEGCGDLNYDTDAVFDKLGYREMANRMGLGLMDLNETQTVLLKNEGCRVFKEFHMPEVAMSHFIISVPVLKAHSLADITGALKNMMGFAQPKYYQQGGHWKKSAFHNSMQQSIIDLNTYTSPDLAIMDATIGMPDYHLGGRECDPPVNKIIASFDPREVDRKGAELIGLNWKEIGHLA